METVSGSPAKLFSVVIILADCLLSVSNEQSLNRSSVRANNTLNLVHKIRRQLMKDNYDYSSSEEDATITAKYNLHTVNTRTVKQVKDQEVKYTGRVNAITNQQDQHSDRIDKSHDRQYRNSEHINRFIDYQNNDHNAENSKRQSKYPDCKSKYSDQVYRNNQQDTRYDDGAKYPYFKTEDSNYYPNRLHKDPPDRLLFPDLSKTSPDHEVKHINDPNASDHQSIYPEIERYPKLDESYPDSSHATVTQLKKQVYNEADAIRRIVGNSRNSYAPITDRGFSVSNRDLLYYMDDKRMRRRGGVDGNLMDSPTSIETDDYVDDVTNGATSKAKYRVIKVKAADSSRRKMAYRRFVEARDSEGVSLFRLDNGPFPQFRLPRTRRQFMVEDELGGNRTIDSNDG
ncbi:hypothetical protein evm_001318 [Chilo suppressalis]|nr:hypothetical protein evm_001318 [Chilo suppressalis]